MENFYIKETKSTPRVVFDVDKAVLRLEGQSYPENAFKFYEPIFALVKEQLENKVSQIGLEIYFHMPYINTSSSKCIMMLLDQLEMAYLAGYIVRVKWYYDRENEMALECAEEFQEDLTMPFEICVADDNIK